MVQPWWAVGLAVPALVVKQIVSGKSRDRVQEDDGLHNRIDEGTDPTFLCERVCTSDRLLRRMGSLSKDPTPGTCVTVCGTDAVDACTEACQRAVCVNLHQVPAWNTACQKRCTAECLRGRTW